MATSPRDAQGCGTALEPLAPGGVIGILGGGQLGRMLAVAAARLGFRVHIFSPGADEPASHVAHQTTRAPYEDLDAVRVFARAVDVVTYEFENVPAATAEAAGAEAVLRPNAAALAATQDRLNERRLIESAGQCVAAYRSVASLSDLQEAVAEIGRPAVLKTRRFGYDGKGQMRIVEGTDIGRAWAAVSEVPCILEAHVPFAFEISVIAVRGLDGSLATYDIARNEHRDGILRASSVPAEIPPEARNQAGEIARQVTEKLDYVGTMGIELFYAPGTSGGPLIVNEIAPRVHNSGHWTQDAATTCQFENHIRAIAGWPLGATDLLAPVEMTNLIGEDVERWPDLARDLHAHLHLYGKSEVRAGRKMGHVNRLLGSAPRSGEGR